MTQIQRKEGFTDLIPKPLCSQSFPLGCFFNGSNSLTVVAQINNNITELICFEPEVSICNEINRNSRENL